MGEDWKGDATASQHHPVAVSQCLLMIYSCRVVGGWAERRRGAAHPPSSPLISPAVACSVSICTTISSSFLHARADIAHKQRPRFLSVSYFFTKEPDEFETLFSMLCLYTLEKKKKRNNSNLLCFGVWCRGFQVSPSNAWTGSGLQWRPCERPRHRGSSHRPSSFRNRGE